MMSVQDNDNIQLVDHDPAWGTKAAEEIQLLKDRLPTDLVRQIDHTGSTSIPGIQAKPVIDLIILVTSIQKAQSVIPIIKENGYQYWEKNPGSLSDLISFCEAAAGKNANLAQRQLNDNHSPYDGTAEKSMNTDLLRSFVSAAPSSTEWMRELVFKIAEVLRSH